MTLTRDVATPHTLAEAALINNNFTNCGKELQPKSLIHNIKFYKNKIPGMLLDGFENTADWTTTNCSIVTDETVKLEGDNSIKLDPSDNTSSITKNTAIGDLSKYVGVVSGMPIRGKALLHYLAMTDHSWYSTTIKLIIGSSSSDYIYKTTNIGFQTGSATADKFWYILVDLTDFTQVGTVDWTNITYIKIEIVSSSHYTLYTYYLDGLYLLPIAVSNKLVFTKGNIYYDGVAYAVASDSIPLINNRQIVATCVDGVATISLEDYGTRIQDETKLLLGYIDENGKITLLFQNNSELDDINDYVFEQKTAHGSSANKTWVFCGEGYFDSAYAFAEAQLSFDDDTATATTSVTVYIDGELLTEDSMQCNGLYDTWDSTASAFSQVSRTVKFNYSLIVIFSAHCIGHMEYARSVLQFRRKR